MSARNDSMYLVNVAIICLNCCKNNINLVHFQQLESDNHTDNHILALKLRLYSAAGDIPVGLPPALCKIMGLAVEVGYILFDGGDGAYVELLFENFQYVGGKECRERRTGVNVLHSE